MSAPCPSCTAEVRPGARFCRTCGARVDERSSTRELPGISAAPAGVTVEVDAEAGTRDGGGRSPRGLPGVPVLAAIGAAVVILAVVVGLVVAGSGDGGDDQVDAGGDGGAASAGGDAELAAPSGLTADLAAEGCDGDECTLEIAFTDESDGEADHDLYVTQGDGEPDPPVLAPSGEGTGETLTQTATVAANTRVCVAVEATAGGERSEASEPTCLLVTPDEEVVPPDEVAAPWGLAEGQCVALFPGDAWDGEDRARFLRVVPCGLSGRVFYVEDPHAGGDPSGTCRGNPRRVVDLPPLSTPFLTENPAGDQVLTCIAHT